MRRMLRTSPSGQPPQSSNPDARLVQAWMGKTDDQVREAIRQETLILTKRPMMLAGQSKVVDQLTGQIIGADLHQAMVDSRNAIHLRQRLLELRRLNNLGPYDPLPTKYEEPHSGN